MILGSTVSKEKGNHMVLGENKVASVADLSYFHESFILLIASIFLKGAVNTPEYFLYLIDWLIHPTPNQFRDNSLQEQLIHCIQEKLNLAKGAHQSLEGLLRWEAVMVILCQLGPACSGSLQSWPNVVLIL